MAAATRHVHYLPALWAAASHGRIQKVKHLLTNGADIEERGGPYKSTPLHIASLSSYEEVVLILLEMTADVSVKNKDGETPLHYAALGGHTIVARLLLSKGADVSATDNHGRMPLHFAVNENVAKLLIEHGAELSATASDGTTALHCAAVQGRAAVLQLLLDKGADVQSKSNDGMTPFDVATAGSHHQIAAILKAEAKRRAMSEAFAMGQQERLGAGSWVQELEAGVVRMVLEQV